MISRVLIIKVLSDKTGFEYFAAHLIKELACENILFLIELFELKETMIENGYIMNPNETIKWKIDIISEFILPLTSIDKTMNASNMTQKCVDFAMYLYYQYIATNSNYTINVKSRTRAKIANWLEKNYDELKGTVSSLKLTQRNSRHQLLNMSLKNVEEEKEYVDNAEDNDKCLTPISDDDKMNTQCQLLQELFLLLHDRCGQEVYLLLSLDSYYRFSQTQAFKAWHEMTNGVVVED